MYEFIKLAISAVVLSIIWTAEGAWPVFAGRHHRTRHYGANITIGIVNSAVTGAIFATAITLVTARTTAHKFGLQSWLGLPSPASWIVMLVVFDLWQYCWHRLNHKSSLLWRFHSVHHSDAELDASSALRFHTGEIGFSCLARLAVLPALGMTAPQLAVYELISFPIVLFHHSNVRYPEKIDRILRYLIVTPRMHWVHHSAYRPETDSNFATVLSVWDRIGRTFKRNERPETIRLGLDTIEEWEWRGLRGPALIPFRRRGSNSVVVTNDD